METEVRNWGKGLLVKVLTDIASIYPCKQAQDNVKKSKKNHLPILDYEKS